MKLEDVKKICVVGAGVMGHQIAQNCAEVGYPVFIRDISDEFVQKGLSMIKSNLQRFFVEKGKMTQQDADALIGRIKGTTNLAEAAKDADVVIEAVIEDMEVKQNLFRELDKICPPATILATNTSAMSVTEIGSKTKRQDKVVGLHFFNPIARLRLVEVIRGVNTSEDTFSLIWDLSKKLGKDPVACKDSPGFIAGRIFTAIVNEAAWMVYEGVATPEDIDKAIEQGLGHAAGPCKSTDITDGMAIALHTLEYMEKELSTPRFAPCPLLRQKVRAGHLGRKTGRGFYEYKS